MSFPAVLVEDEPQHHWVRRMIPGIIAGAADLDPAAVMTATVAGASVGLSVGWVVILCIPILNAVFGVAARIGHETRVGLVQLIRRRFGRLIAISIAVMIVAVNVLMIIADLMAVSDALSIILRQSSRFFPAAVAFTIWYVLTNVGYQKVNRTLSLLALFLLSYVVAAVLATDSVSATAHAIVLPKLSTSTAYVMALIAVFGSLLTPDVIVWQTSTKRESGASFHNVESKFGCVVACIVSLSALIAASKMSVLDPSSMTTRQAAAALSRLGDMGPILFSLGILGSGMVALPILVASLCFSVSEAFGWNYGLSKSPWEARSFFVLICVVLVLSVAINYTGINTVKTLYWSQVLAGIFIVPILFLILKLSNDRRVLKRTNSRWENFWLGGAVGGMLAANIVFFWSELFR
ncbi:MAG TPA: divalent metal cation transporter [Terriglobales bacterium]|nr:divalent metal cation transporter [Terriglobales bacterium]